MQFETFETGILAEQRLDAEAPVSVGSRCVLTDAGELVCCYMRQSALGINDFTPTISRSADGSATWTESGPVWPEHAGKLSIFCSISRGPGPDLFLFGKYWQIDVPGERFVGDDPMSIKPNRLCWSRSGDDGRTWDGLHSMAVPQPCAAEAPGPMLVTRSGRWLGPYSPNPVIDQKEPADLAQVVVMISDDRGRTWRHRSMLRFDDPGTRAAEAWVAELADGRLVGACYHFKGNDGVNQILPNAFGVSDDQGDNWHKTGQTGVKGQTVSLTGLPDGRALLCFVRREGGSADGVWLTTARPGGLAFNPEHTQIVWQPQRAGVQQDEPGSWLDFKFGEPSLTVLTEDTVLVTFWFLEPDRGGIRYLKVRLPG